MLFQIYGDNSFYQLLGWILVFAGLVIFNEIARRSKAGGIFCFFVLPAALTVYFIAIAIGAKSGAEWALNNQTHIYMNGWFHYAKLYAATAGCIGFMMLKYKWGIGKKEWFKVFPFAIVAINILIAVASDFESAIKGVFTGGWWLSSENVWIYGGWIQNRANTLALWCMYAQVFPLFLDDSKFSVLSSVYPEGYTTSMMVQGINPETVGAANPKAQAVVSIIALVANVCILAAIIKRSVEQKKNPYKNEIFTDQKNYKDALLRAAEANREIA